MGNLIPYDPFSALQILKIRKENVLLHYVPHTRLTHSLDVTHYKVVRSSRKSFLGEMGSHVDHERFNYRLKVKDNVYFIPYLKSQLKD